MSGTFVLSTHLDEICSDAATSPGHARIQAISVALGLRVDEIADWTRQAAPSRTAP